ncbi:MAG: succinate--CoA ligase subunit alpha [Candidatus Njordarchaeia archaeon]
MTVLVNKDTKVIVQGITGNEGSFHTKLMLEYGTKIVAGVVPGRHGQEVHGVPVYDTIKEAKKEHDATASVIFVPAKFAPDAAIEAIENDLNPVVVITEGIPTWDTARFVNLAKKKGIHVIGPNCPGLIAPGDRVKIGILPGHVFAPGDIGVLSRSGTLTYEIAKALTDAGLGQSITIGVGGDPIRGTNLVEAVKLLNGDPDTKKMVVIGEIGGVEEEKVAELYKKGEITKPIVAYIAGRTAPPGKAMGHAGAIILGETGKAEAKIRAFENAGIPVAKLPSEIPELIKQV